jgi:hypothetical protein
VKKAILEHYSVNPERCRKHFRAHNWSRDKEPAEWIAKGMKLLKRWLRPEDGADQMMEKIAVEQFLNGLPQGIRIWVASHNPETPAKVAELMETYDSAHSRWSNISRLQYQKPGRDQQQKPVKGSPREKKSLTDIICYKCNKKGHIAKHVYVRKQKESTLGKEK